MVFSAIGDQPTFEQFHTEFLGPVDGPRLVFLHGLMGSASNFKRIAKAFEGRFRILLLDQRGHGRSVKPTKGYAPEDYASDLKMICDHLGWSKINLVGHSMGGRNAMSFAFKYPECVEKLVIEDIGPDANPQAILKIERLLNSVPTPFKDKATARDFFLNHFPDKVLGQYLYTNIEEKQIELASAQKLASDGPTAPETVFDWRFSKESIFASVREGRSRDRWDILEALKMPTLFVRGDRSDEFSRASFDECLKRNPQVTGIEIADSGHWVHFDQPEAFIETLSRFL